MSSSSKAVVLFSGGQDSTTCLFLACALYDDIIAVSVHYGQRHRRELDAAAQIVERANSAFAIGRGDRGPKVTPLVLEMPALAQIGDSALVDKSREILGAGGRHDVHMPEGLPTSFVPGRNLLMLSLAASVAVRERAKVIVSGVCQTDFSGYPDCRREFVDAVEKAATLAMPSSSGPIRIETPLMYLTKAETARMAARLGPLCLSALALSVTCYEGERPGCGRCPACSLRAKGFEEAGFTDPALDPTFGVAGVAAAGPG